MQRLGHFQPDIAVNAAQIGKIQQFLGLSGRDLGVIPVVGDHHQDIVLPAEPGGISQVRHKGKISAVIGVGRLPGLIRSRVRQGGVQEHTV